MRKILVLAALGALVITPALAQDHRGRGNGNGNGQQNRAAAPSPQQQAPQQQAPRQQAPQRAAPQQNVERDRGRSDFNRGADFNRNNAMAGPRPAQTRPDQRPSTNMAGPRPDNNRAGNVRPGNNGFAGPRPESRPGPRPDFRAYNRNFTAPHRFRAPAYHRPPGFYVRRWTFGQFLPSPFWVRDYWLSDFADFDLPPPPPGTVWVRYGDDALLIDRYSGEIIEVDYNVFY